MAADGQNIFQPAAALVAFALAITLCAVEGSAADLAKAQVEAIALRYNQAEGQLQRAVHYVAKENLADGETKTDQAWFHENGDLLKVATERTGPAGRRLTEFFFNEDRMVMFVFTRTESPLVNRRTKVEEERLYFGGDDQGVIRDLVKTASFKPGEPLETVGVTNIARDLRKRPKHPEEEPYDHYSRVSGEIQETLMAKSPDRDPRKGAGGDSAKFRLIQGSASPDGRYALAIGLGRNEINWEQFSDGEVNGTDVYTVEQEDDLRNYVVDLDTHRILGETGGKHFGTRASYNNRSCSVAWAPDNSTFVQLMAEKWHYVACRAGCITAGPKLAGTVDLGRQTEKSAFAFLRANKDRAFHKHEKEIETAIDLGKVTNEGVINISIGGEVPRSKERDDGFKVIEDLRLHSTSGGLNLETLEVRYAPKE